MKTILTTILIILGSIQIWSSTINQAHPSAKNILKYAETYNYVFMVDGIDNYGYKSFIDYIEEIFGKRPVYNPSTGKFHNELNEFVINASEVQISQADFSNKLSNVGITLTSFNGSLVTESIHEQPK